jgi:hypothetical protein
MKDNHRLSVNCRLPMIFDASNKLHRRYFWEFQTNRSWKDCPYLWIIDDESESVPHMINKKLLVYYTTNEFAKTKKLNN